MNHRYLRTDLYKRLINEECPYIMYTLLRMGPSISICGFTMPTVLFSRDQLSMVFTKGTTAKTDHSCSLDLTSLEVNVTAECGLVIVKLTGRMWKCP